MAEEEWERPIGLTKEYAICIDDSGDEAVDAVETGASSISNERRTGSKVSSYFQKRSQPNNGGVKVHHSQVMNVGINDNRFKVVPAPDNNNSGGGSDQRKKKRKDGIATQDGGGDNVQSKNGDIDDNDSILASNTGSIEGGESNINIQSATQDGGKENEVNKMPDENDSLQASLNTALSEIAAIETGGDAAKKENPFACFAFKAGEASSSSSSWRARKRPRENTSSSQHQQKQKKIGMLASNNQKKQRKQPDSLFSKTPTRNRDNTTSQAVQSQKLTQSEIAEAQQTKKIERQRLIAKWHDFADSNAPIEQQRFQVLVAARIHARCQEPMVKKAMDRLRDYFNEKDGLGSAIADENAESKEQTQSSTQQQMPNPATNSQSQTSMHQGLTIHSLASSNPETEIAPLLSSVLFGNAKAKQIVQAAQDILKKYRGGVPESICSLKEITGIGPKLAEILHIVNRRDTYQQ